MAQLSDVTRKVARDLMSRSAKRMDGAADAVELVRTGVHRRAGEGEEATVIRSVVATLTTDKVGSVPAPARLLDLNGRRNTSIHGHWTEVLDRDALADAIVAGREFHREARVYLDRRGVALDA